MVITHGILPTRVWRRDRLPRRLRSAPADVKELPRAEWALHPVQDSVHRPSVAGLGSMLDAVAGSP